MAPMARKSVRRAWDSDSGCRLRHWNIRWQAGSCLEQYGRKKMHLPTSCGFHPAECDRSGNPENHGYRVLTGKDPLPWPYATWRVTGRRPDLYQYPHTHRLRASHRCCPLPGARPAEHDFSSSRPSSALAALHRGCHHSLPGPWPSMPAAGCYTNRRYKGKAAV
ncbi:hypothetical protein BMS3Bbin11_00093 [bacterium BMS3Bbin11]|nr:hypothetical protein BMS3Bbin11_00093 [bacterium BMS3Bbin11]